MFKKFYKFTVILFIICIIATLIAFPEKYSSICKEGILLWCNSVLPSLFPFLFLSSLMNKLNYISNLSNKFSPLTKRLFNLNGISSYCIFMSLISGYPVGSRVIYDLKENGLITKNESTKMSPLCSTSGPIYVIGTVGTNMFKNSFVGILIFICHVFSVFICGIIFRLYKKEDGIQTTGFLSYKNVDNIIGESVYSAITSILSVGGFITLFYTLIKMLTNWYVLMPFAMLVCLILKPFNCSNLLALAFVSGLIESTTGCVLLSNYQGVLSYALACFLITFGGISILSQQIYYLKKSEVKISYFLLLKFLQGIIAFFLCYLLCSICIN